MYDTIKFSLPTYETDKALSVLEDVKEHINKHGVVSYTGMIRNIKIGINDYGLTGTGSLPKFYHGNNLISLTRQDTKRAIEELSDILLLQINNASIFRIDVAQNLIMKHPVNCYTCKLGEARYFSKDTYHNKQGILFKNGSRSMAFYDKIVDAQRHRKAISEPFQGRNVLRYENRFLRRLKQHFGRSVTASMMYDETFYIDLINRWKTGYFSIHKINEEGLGLNMKGQKELIHSLAFIGLKTIGGEDVIFDEIQSARLKGEIDKHQVSRMKKKINEITSNPSIVNECEEIQELDKKVRQAVEYYR